MSVLRNLVRASVAMLILAAHPGFAEPLHVFRDCEVCPEMIELPLGEFVMGAPEDEFRRNIVVRDGKVYPATPDHPYVEEDEGPQNKVKVDLRIAMGKNEVTYDEWMACVNDGGCDGYVPDAATGRAGSVEAIMRSLTDPMFTHTPSEKNIAEAVAEGDLLPLGGRYPVLYVSYADAHSYVEWLNQKLRTDAYRLPTEAEWEYAARAETTSRFAQGFEITSDQATFNGEATEYVLREKRPDLRTLGYPVPVDELGAANNWGLRHMSGNAGEITKSCYTEHLQSWSTTSEWLERSSADNCERVTRGGSYVASMDVLRVAWRGPDTETSRSKFNGFRVVKELD